MKKITIVLDAAHGQEIPGKRSPDERFREYKWSRQIIFTLKNLLQREGYNVIESNPTNIEIGLSKRARVANNAPDPKIFISIHANAMGNMTEWMPARGYSVYTSKGETKSDKLEEIMMKQFSLDFPELRARPNKEENFTVLVKTTCPAVLIEWCFQDNKEDVEILLSNEYNNRFVSSLIKSINKINDTLF